jgi:hypothetical protein
MSVAVSKVHRKGSRLLLAHCLLFWDWDRTSANERLEQQIGGDLARKLVYALARPQAGRGGSSSP